MDKPNGAAVERILKRATLEAEAAGAAEVGVNHLIIAVNQEPAAKPFLTQPAWDEDELREGKRKTQP